MPHCRFNSGKRKEGRFLPIVSSEVEIINIENVALDLIKVVGQKLKKYCIPQSVGFNGDLLW